MRIIAGKFKGLRLQPFKGQHLRPTMDRIKESLFNILQGEVEDARVLDLFSGTGNLSLEAISRGAKEVVAVENHRDSLAIIRKNLAHFKIKDEITLVPSDVFKFLQGFMGEPFAIILIDPPFTKKIGHEVMEALASSSVLAPACTVAIETGKHERIDDEYPPLKLKDRRDYGDKSLSLFYLSPP